MSDAPRDFPFFATHSSLLVALGFRCGYIHARFEKILLPEEEEVLIPSGTRFRITKKEIKRGRYFFELEELPSL